MIANYGYKDGSGEYFIVINTDLCDGCGRCAEVCPQGVFEVITDDYDEVVAAVTDEHRNKLKFSCAPCKPLGEVHKLPCVSACEPVAIGHFLQS